MGLNMHSKVDSSFSNWQSVIDQVHDFLLDQDNVEAVEVTDSFWNFHSTQPQPWTVTVNYFEKFVDILVLDFYPSVWYKTYNFSIYDDALVTRHNLDLLQTHVLALRHRTISN